MESTEQKREVAAVLFEEGRLSPEQLQTVHRLQRRSQRPQHALIVDHGLASEEEVWRALANLHALEFVDLCDYAFAPGVLESVPLGVMLSERVIPVAIAEDQLTLAFAEPPRQAELNKLRLLLNRRLQPVLTTPSCVRAVIQHSFGLGAETIQRLRQDRGLIDGTTEVVFDVSASDDEREMDATIGRFVDQLLAEALRFGATDIHIEPYLDKINMRYRIDGVLQQVPTPRGLREVYAALVSRIKVMASLDIAEKRVPHDGRITTKTGGEDYDLRVSIIPTKHGEAVCLRILGRKSLSLDLRTLGLNPAQERLMHELTGLPQGMVLITGPTGSGKTTTLYAALAQADDEGRKIITIEDPIEYQLEGVLQIQTKDEVGLTFASGLRSVLRHDPDVVLIGEIRDRETAEIAVRAAQTGHLVFSTLHTNDSLSAIIRMLEMEIDPFLLGSSLVCSIAQRLAQRICRHCRERDLGLTEAQRDEMAAALGLLPAELQAWRGRGCVECGQRGCRGRLAIYEFFVPGEEVADLLGPGLKTGELRRLARTQGWRSLREEAWPKVQEGLIPVAEVERLTRRIKSEWAGASGRLT